MAFGHYDGQEKTPPKKSKHKGGKHPGFHSHSAKTQRKPMVKRGRKRG